MSAERRANRCYSQQILESAESAPPDLLYKRSCFHRPDVTRVVADRLGLLGYGVTLVSSGAFINDCVTLASNITNLRLQLAVDDANAEIVHFLAELPPNTRVAVNIPQNSEYLFELGLHLSSLKMRPDIKLEPCQGSACLSGEGKYSFYLVTPELDNQLLPSVRIGADEGTVTAWNHALNQVLGAQTQSVYKTERKIQLLDFGFHRIVCLLSPGGGGLYCNYPRHFVEARICRYGWKVFHVNGSSAPGVASIGSRQLTEAIS